jgi:hypothetical protein
MSKKVISFLGATQLTETTYCLDGRECRTCFMAEAAARFFAPDELYVIVTNEARAKNLADLERRLADYLAPQAVDIPSGKTEAELWAIFNAIAGVIDEQDTIIFDVTNAFRSLPILTFLVASYVRVVRHANVERMVYGAFEAKIGERTPVFELTPFVRLLDWTSATDAFLKYGRADDLAELAGGTKLSVQLKAMTEALQTSRPAETMEVADGLEATIAATRAAMPPAQQPFALLLDRIGAEYGGFGLRRPRDSPNAAAMVRKQRATIGWYIDKGLYVQAMTSAREWIVSLVVLLTGGDLFAKTQRNNAERLLNDNPKTPSTLDPALVPRLDNLRKLWLDAREVRNSLAHGGMAHDAPRAKTVIEHARKVAAQLEQFLEAGYATS